MKTLSLILLSVIASGGGQLLLRSGMLILPALSPSALGQPSTWLALIGNWQVVAGLLAWGVSTILWLIVLNRTELAYAYPLGSLNYILVPMLSQWLFGETLTGLRWVGIGVIMVGVLITIYGRPTL